MAWLEPGSTTRHGMTGMLVERQEFAGVKTLGSGRTRCRPVRCGVHRGVRLEDIRCRKKSRTVHRRDRRVLRGY